MYVFCALTSKLDLILLQDMVETVLEVGIIGVEVDGTAVIVIVEENIMEVVEGVAAAMVVEIMVAVKEDAMDHQVVEEIGIVLVVVEAVMVVLEVVDTVASLV